MIADTGFQPAESDDDGSPRPPHPASIGGPLVDWCKLSSEEQVRAREERAFERRLKAKVQELHQAGWHERRLIAFADEHRARFRTKVRSESLPQVPCKHWRERYEGTSDDPVLGSLLDGLWSSSVQSWKLEHPYLGTPSAACECPQCDPHGAQMRKATKDGVFELGEMDY